MYPLLSFQGINDKIKDIESLYDANTIYGIPTL